MASPNQIWMDLFTQHKLATKITDIAVQEEGMIYELENYGKVRVFATKASAIGDNYMSDAYTMKIQLSDGSELFSFVKVLPSNPVLREGVRAAKVYDREIAAYKELIPRILKHQQQHGISEDQVPIARPLAYYVHLDENDKGQCDGIGTAVVLEDLKRSGHAMVDKRAGCDYQHAHLTLQALANYHAASIAFVRNYKNGDRLKDFPPELNFLSEKTFFEVKCSEMARSIIPMHAGILRSHQLNTEADWIEELIPKLGEIVRFWDDIEDCGHLPAIIHGDAWVNNIMYQYEEGQVKKATLVDWQIISFGHPASDILHYLFNSTTYETREKYLDKLLSDYFDTLSKKLSLYGIHLEQEGYNLEKFRAEVEERYICGMIMALLLLPMILETKVVDQLKEYETEENKALSGSEAEDLMAESEQKLRNLCTTDFVLENKVLCKRIVEMVPEVMKVVKKLK